MIDAAEIFETPTAWPRQPGICHGQVWHKRTRPRQHRFDYNVAFVWVDPDRFSDLTVHHWAWGTTRLRPVLLRRSDYGARSVGSLGDEVRADLEPVLDGVPIGSIRMLTQARRWGWLFNPITIYLAWSDVAPDERPERDDVLQSNPIGAVLEVTNTPWKERHRYPLALTAGRNGDTVASMPTARFDKSLHVSPFLDQRFQYQMSVAAEPQKVSLKIDVVGDGGELVLATGMELEYSSATATVLARSIVKDRLSTVRVSAGIHYQAARLWRKGVPFVAHPKRKAGHGRPK